MKDGDHVTAIDVLAGAEPRARKCVLLHLSLDADAPVAIMPKCKDGDHSECVSVTGQTQHGYITWCYPEVEGITWCHGWDGPAADALLVAYALRPC